MKNSMKISTLAVILLFSAVAAGGFMLTLQELRQSRIAIAQLQVISMISAEMSSQAMLACRASEGLQI